jgi:argininosuccinate lyase
VAYAIEQDKPLDGLSLKELRKFHQGIGADVFEVLTLSGSVAARDHIGGTAPTQVRSAIQRGRAWLDS